MEKRLSGRKLENENNYIRENQIILRCDKCNGTFPKPILATVSSRGYVQTYQACPRCLSKITDIDYDRNKKGKQTSVSMKKAKRVAEKHEDNVKCGHFLGYLKKHSKDTPFPDECLTCDKMIECLLH